ncbi:MAG TPA: DNA polymerase III subunit delta', partial [Polyangiales bacterium]|nr:DNA polymerase III subunit delta' [Polyangiales bacterium]
MSFDEISAQAPAVATLRRALASGRVAHAYLFEGPGGVGKGLAALALAQALLCEAGGCGTCATC